MPPRRKTHVELADASPHALTQKEGADFTLVEVMIGEKLGSRALRIRASSWLAKLRVSGSVLPDFRSLRNSYLRLLKAQVREGALRDPFVSRPPEGPLPKLPAHMLLEAARSRPQARKKKKPRAKAAPAQRRSRTEGGIGLVEGYLDDKAFRRAPSPEPSWGSSPERVPYNIPADADAPPLRPPARRQVLTSQLTVVADLPWQDTWLASQPAVPPSAQRASEAASPAPAPPAPTAAETLSPGYADGSPTAALEAMPTPVPAQAAVPSGVLANLNLTLGGSGTTDAFSAQGARATQLQNAELLTRSRRLDEREEAVEANRSTLQGEWTELQTANQMLSAIASGSTLAEGGAGLDLSSRLPLLSSPLSLGEGGGVGVSARARPMEQATRRFHAELAKCRDEASSAASALDSERERREAAEAGQAKWKAKVKLAAKSLRDMQRQLQQHEQRARQRQDEQRQEEREDGNFLLWLAEYESSLSRN